MRFAPAALTLLVLGSTLAGCAPHTPLACPRPASVPRTAQVYYATDRRRQLDETNGGTLRFAGARTDPPGLHLGWERVSLGPAHRLGLVDDAVAVTPAHEQTRSPDAAPTDVLRHSDAEIAAFVETRLRPAIRAAPPPRPGTRRQVLVYIHGYNTTFDYAVRKTAQLAGDLELVDCAGQPHGVAIAYSWPARGALLSYLADEENAEWTQQRLEPFVQALARTCQQEDAELSLVAHSMGARALVRSLASLAKTCEQEHRHQGLADHVILLAPDIGKGLFDQYVERFLPFVGRLTIYVSAKDGALSLSRLLHGGHARLGLIESTVRAALELTGLKPDDHLDLAAKPVSTPDNAKVDIIDVTGGPAAHFGHSYEGAEFIADLRALIYHNTPAGTGERANLQRREVGAGLFHNLTGKELRYYRLRAS